MSRVGEIGEWEKRAATLVAAIGTPLMGLLGALVAATLIVDCDDLDFPLEQQQCIARAHSIKDDWPAVVGGAIIGGTIALVASGAFRLIGQRMEERSRSEDLRRQFEQPATTLLAADQAPEERHDDTPDQRRRWSSASKGAEAKAAEESRSPPGRTDSAEAERDEQDDGDRDFSDY